VRHEAYVPFSMNVFVPSEGTRESLEYLCGLLNSRVLWKWYLHHAKRRGVGLEINGRVLARTPIRRIDFSRPDEIQRHDQIAALAQTMFALTRRQSGDPPASVPTALSAERESVDCQLDRFVYDLYGLTGEEIDRVEAATACERPLL